MTPHSTKRNFDQGSSVKVTNLRFVKEMLLKLDPSLASTQEDKSYNTAIVLLSAFACGPDTTRLAEFTHLPREFVAMLRQRMIQAQLWSETDVFCDHWDVAEGVFCTTFFWVDVLVAQGLVVRQWVEGAGQYRYWDNTFAQERERHRQRVN